jgi:hypothetical protein
MTPRTPENTPLALVAQPTLQQIFDAVVTHAAGMPRKCQIKEGGACLYRGSQEGDEGNACFVGALLTDDEVEKLKGPPLGIAHFYMEDLNLIPERFQDEDKYRPLLVRLQRVHDASHQDMWPEGLKDVARVYALDGSSVDRTFGARLTA